MIVRNNAGTIRACLESIKPFVDEMIVVDTGSTDATPEICRELGAQVYHFLWPDSFAIARNESLKYARGEWIFWMDSDDIIDAENGRKLRELVAELVRAPATSVGNALCGVPRGEGGLQPGVTELVRFPAARSPLAPQADGSSSLERSQDGRSSQLEPRSACGASGLQSPLPPDPQARTPGRGEGGSQSGVAELVRVPASGANAANSHESAYKPEPTQTANTHCSSLVAHRSNILGYVMQVHCPGQRPRRRHDVTVVDHLKLFRNRPDLRFEGRIHEQVLDAINRAGGDIVFTDIFVVHAGADETPAGKARKLDAT